MRGLERGDREYARRRFGSAAMGFIADLIVDVREMRKVEDMLESSDRSVMAFKDSHLSAVGSVSVAAAIISQLSSTTLQMPSLSNVHWTAPGCIIASLLFGVLAVILATIQQQVLGMLNSAEGVRMWLSNGRFYPPHALCRPLYDAAAHEADAGSYCCCSSSSSTHLASRPQFRGTAPRGRRRLQVSFAALQLLSMPHKFLSAAVAFFLAGFALYLGFAYRQDLDDTPARDNNEAVFVAFVGVASVAVVSGMGVSLWKVWEVRGAERRTDRDFYRDDDDDDDDEDFFGGQESEESGYEADESQVLGSPQLERRSGPRGWKAASGRFRHEEIAEALEAAARLHKRVARLMMEESEED